MYVYFATKSSNWHKLLQNVHRQEAGKRGIDSDSFVHFCLHGVFSCTRRLFS